MHQLSDQLRLDSLMGPAVAGPTKGPALHDPLRDQHWHNSLSSLALVGSN